MFCLRVSKHNTIVHDGIKYVTLLVWQKKSENFNWYFRIFRLFWTGERFLDISIGYSMYSFVSAMDDSIELILHVCTNYYFAFIKQNAQ